MISRVGFHTMEKRVTSARNRAFMQYSVSVRDNTLLRKSRRNLFSPHQRHFSNCFAATASRVTHCIRDKIYTYIQRNSLSTRYITSIVSLFLRESHLCRWMRRWRQDGARVGRRTNGRRGWRRVGWRGEKEEVLIYGSSLRGNAGSSWKRIKICLIEF